MAHENKIKLIDQEVEEIEESRKDFYIENYATSLNEHLEKIQIHVKSAIHDAIFIDKLIKSKSKKKIL